MRDKHWTYLLERYQEYDEERCGNAYLLKFCNRYENPVFSTKQYYYLDAARKYTNSEYGIDVGDVVLMGLEKEPFLISHFTISGNYSDIGEIEINGYYGHEVDESKKEFFRADLVPWEKENA